MSILLCYDGSPSSRRALNVACDTLGAKSLTLLHVWDPPDDVLPDAFGADQADSGPSGEYLERLAVERAQTVASAGAEEAAELGCDAEVRIERDRGEAWQTILEIADEIDAELLVIGTHGTTAVQSELLGSVSGAVVHHSQRPVLVVPKQPN
jgi:nucleotide-binding universal stress UspA family protein